MKDGFKRIAERALQAEMLQHQGDNKPAALGWRTFTMTFWYTFKLALKLNSNNSNYKKLDLGKRIMNRDIKQNKLFTVNNFQFSSIWL